MANVIYINSYMRSGSTILGLLLSELFSGVFLGETRNLFKTLNNEMDCTCGASFSDCRFWSELIHVDSSGIGPTKQVSRIGTWPIYAQALLTGKVGGVGEIFGKIIPQFKNEIDAAMQVKRVYELVNEQYAPPLVIDSSHRIPLLVLLNEYVGDDLKVIRLVRDGRAVTSSVMRREGKTPKNSARLWKRFNLLSDKIIERVIDPAQVLFVRYEDLVNNFEMEAERLSRFVGLPLPVNLKEKTIIQLNKHHFIGGSSTVKKRSELILHLDERWKSELSKKDREDFDKVAGPLNRRYGYVR